jgi:Zn-dependent protease with chaperone function
MGRDRMGPDRLPRDRLPRASTTRFILLIMMICAASMFAAYWWLVALRGDWLTEQNVCVTALGRTAAGPAGFNACLAGVVLRQEGVILLGPAVVLLGGVLLAAVSVPVMLRVWGAAATPARLASAFRACADEVTGRRPALRTARRGNRGQARVFGMFPRYWVVADPLLVAGTDAQLAAILRHELAHLRAGDVDRARLARSVWGLFFLFVAPALVVSLAVQGGLAWAAVGVRLLVLFVLIHVTYLSLLRTREYEADLMAAAAPGLDTETMAAMVAAKPRRRWYSARLPGLLRAHPAPGLRASALRAPARTARLSVLEFASIGIAAGVVFQELALALGAALPSTELAYWITGAIIGLPVSVVTVSALWRQELSGPDPCSRRPVLACGAVLGIGLLAGSQLSPRAATSWGTVQMTVSPLLPSNLSIGVAGAGTIAVLTAVAAAGGAAYTLWVLAASRRLIAATPAGPRTRTRRLFTALAAGVLAVPAGTWFLACVIVADNINGPQGTAIADLLQGRALLVGLAVTAAAAAVPPLAPRWHLRLVPALTAAATLVLLPAVAWSGGAAVRHAITPGPPVVLPRSGDALPLIPASVVNGTGPIQPGSLCYLLGFLTPQDRSDPATWRLTGKLLERTPDRSFDVLGRTLIRAAQTPSGGGHAIAASAWTAAGSRCVIMLSTPLPARSH